VQDLIVLELIITTTLFLAILRPYVKSFRGIDGIAVLPLVAVIASLGIYPAYGFRPELLPLTLLSLMMFVGSIPRLLDVLRRLRTDDYGERGLLRLTVGILSLAATIVFALAYTPKTDGVDGSSAAAYRERIVRDDMRGVELYLRYYPGSEEQKGDLRRPIILIVPPESGSVAVMDRLCAALVDRGFFVATYSRKGTDFPAFHPEGRRIYPGGTAFIRRAFAVFGGMRFAFAARVGAAIERERSADLAFLVDYMKLASEQIDNPYGAVDTDKIVIAGFGTGGAAASLYASSSMASSIVAAVSIEGPIFTALRGEGAPPVPSRAEKTGIVGTWISSLTARFRIERIVGTEDVSGPKVPLLFIVSDRVREPDSRDGRYATILRSLRAAEAPSVLASVDGAGPFDYSEAGEVYPLYSAMMPGLGERNPQPGFYAEKAADLITNFVDTMVGPSEESKPLHRRALGNEVRFETGGSWTATDVADILKP
jgi:dienelactone hydrolase